MRHTESHTQQECVRWFRLAYHQYADLLFAVPNGGRRDAKTGALMKAEGALAGVADLLLLVPNSQYHALCIEMKAVKGVQRLTQKVWQQSVEKQGYKYVLCRSFDEFRLAIIDYIGQ